MRLITMTGVLGLLISLPVSAQVEVPSVWIGGIGNWSVDDFWQPTIRDPETGQVVFGGRPNNTIYESFNVTIGLGVVFVDIPSTISTLTLMGSTPTLRIGASTLKVDGSVQFLSDSALVCDGPGVLNAPGSMLNAGVLSLYGATIWQIPEMSVSTSSMFFNTETIRAAERSSSIWKYIGEEKAKKRGHDSLPRPPCSVKCFPASHTANRRQAGWVLRETAVGDVLCAVKLDFLFWRDMFSTVSDRRVDCCGPFAPGRDGIRLARA